MRDNLRLSPTETSSLERQARAALVAQAFNSIPQTPADRQANMDTASASQTAPSTAPKPTMAPRVAGQPIPADIPAEYTQPFGSPAAAPPPVAPAPTASIVHPRKVAMLNDYILSMPNITPEQKAKRIEDLYAMQKITRPAGSQQTREAPLSWDDFFDTEYLDRDPNVVASFSSGMKRDVVNQAKMFSDQAARTMARKGTGAYDSNEQGLSEYFNDVVGNNQYFTPFIGGFAQQWALENMPENLKSFRTDRRILKETAQQMGVPVSDVYLAGGKVMLTPKAQAQNEAAAADAEAQRQLQSDMATEQRKRKAEAEAGIATKAEFQKVINDNGLKGYVATTKGLEKIEMPKTSVSKNPQFSALPPESQDKIYQRYVESLATASGVLPVTMEDAAKLGKTPDQVASDAKREADRLNAMFGPFGFEGKATEQETFEPAESYQKYLSTPLENAQKFIALVAKKPEQEKAKWMNDGRYIAAMMIVKSALESEIKQTAPAKPEEQPAAKSVVSEDWQQTKQKPKKQFVPTYELGAQTM